MSQTNIEKKDQPEQVQPVQQLPVTSYIPGHSHLVYSQAPVYAPSQVVYQQLVGAEGQQTQVQQPVNLAPTTQYVGTSQVLGSSRLRESIKGESRIEYVPYEKSVIEYEAVQRTEYVPKEKKITDYYAVEYVTEYIPQVYQDKYIEYIPQERVAERVEYQAVERQVVHPPVQEQVQQTVQYVPQQTVQYVPQQTVQYVPQQSYVVQQPVTYAQTEQKVEVKEEKEKQAEVREQYVQQTASFAPQSVILQNSRFVQQPVYQNVQWATSAQQQPVVYQSYVQQPATSVRYLPPNTQFATSQVQQVKQQQAPKRKESRSFLDKLFD